MYSVAAAVIRREGAVLLVEQQGPDDPRPTWALPGGVCEEGELPTDALIREVREETGLVVEELGDLAFMTQVVTPSETPFSLTTAFEVARWSGTLRQADPDGLVRRAAFKPLSEAVQLLGDLPWRSMREPSISYLRAECPAGTTWLYDWRADDSEGLVARLER